jgi:hypothetical protein
LAPRNEKISGEGMSQNSWQKKEHNSWQITGTVSSTLFVTLGTFRWEQPSSG